MAKTTMVADLAKRIERLEAKAKPLRSQPKSRRRDRELRALEIAAGALVSKLRRCDALDPRRDISLAVLEAHVAKTPEAQGVALPAIGEIASIDGELRRVVA